MNSLNTKQHELLQKAVDFIIKNEILKEKKNRYGDFISLFKTTRLINDMRTNQEINIIFCDKMLILRSNVRKQDLNVCFKYIFDFRIKVVDALYYYCLYDISRKWREKFQTNYDIDFNADFVEEFRIKNKTAKDLNVRI